jgi:hypothetical protein
LLPDSDPALGAGLRGWAAGNTSAAFPQFLRKFRRGKHFNSRRDSIDALKNR